MNFAYVKFVDDGHRTIVRTTDIKKFKLPVDQQKKYKVKFEDHEYYYAQILCTGDDEEQLRQIMKNKRLSGLPLHMLQSEEEITSSAEESDNPAVNKVKKNMKISRNTANENFKGILKEINNNGDDDNNKSKELTMELNKLKRENCDLKDKILILESSLAELKETNFNLQQKILEDWQGISEQIKQMMENFETNNKEPNSTTHVFKELPAVGARTREMTHCGRDVWVPNHIFDSLFAQSKSNSIFIRDLAEYIFGQKCLAESSVSGKPCNKTGGTARPALDGTKLMAIQDTLRYKLMQQGASEEFIQKECSHIKSVLSQKIIDLKRGPRQTKNIQRTAKKQDLNNLEVESEKSGEDNSH